jgi:hypothetical protein
LEIFLLTAHGEGQHEQQQEALHSTIDSLSSRAVQPCTIDSLSFHFSHVKRQAVDGARLDGT